MRIIAISCDLPRNMVAVLDGYFDKILKVGRCSDVLPPICSHPDMQMVKLDEKTVVVSPYIDSDMIMELEHFGIEVIIGGSRLSRQYPFDIAYNVAMVGNCLFCYEKYTDKILLSNAKRRGYVVCPVRQGYAKCSTAVIDDTSVITDDTGIYEAAKANNIIAMLVPHDENIHLDGMNYGFIGGTIFSEKGRIYITGNIDNHKAHDEILRFVCERNTEYVCLSDTELTDYGGAVIFDI